MRKDSMNVNTCYHLLKLHRIIKSVSTIGRKPRSSSMDNQPIFLKINWIISLIGDIVGTVLYSRILPLDDILRDFR
jgi:hypothetical protein